MKVKIKATDKIVEAKRFKDLTLEEVKATTYTPDAWKGNEILVPDFITNKPNAYIYMHDREVEIVEE